MIEDEKNATRKMQKKCRMLIMQVLIITSVRWRDIIFYFNVLRDYI